MLWLFFSYLPEGKEASSNPLHTKNKLGRWKQKENADTSSRKRCFRFLLGWMQPYCGPSLYNVPVGSKKGTYPSLPVHRYTFSSCSL